MAESPPQFVYVTYINTTPEKLWEALTHPDFTQRYWGGRRIVSDWKVGSPVTYLKPDGSAEIKGEVLRSDPPRELSYSWKSVIGPSGEEPESPTRVTFKIAQPWGSVQLTVTHDGFPPESRLFPFISMGWPAILSSLKSLLETGEPLPSTWKG